MLILSRPLFWLRLRLSGSRCSSQATVKGAKDIRVGAGVRIGRQTEINATGGPISIGDGASLGPFTLVESRGGHVHIGEQTDISPYCILYGHGGLDIGRDCIIAARATFIPANHVTTDTDRPIRLQGETKKGIRVGDGVWIGTGATLLDGVSIGEGAVIGAGAVVNRDIPPYCIAVGVPAKVVRSRKG